MVNLGLKIKVSFQFSYLDSTDLTQWISWFKIYNTDAITSSPRRICHHKSNISSKREYLQRTEAFWILKIDFVIEFKILLICVWRKKIGQHPKHIEKSKPTKRSSIFSLGIIHYSRINEIINKLCLFLPIQSIIVAGALC